MIFFLIKAIYYFSEKLIFTYFAVYLTFNSVGAFFLFFPRLATLLKSYSKATSYGWLSYIIIFSVEQPALDKILKN